MLVLPFQYRAPIHLFYYEGLPVAQIAAVPGKSEGAVKPRLSRGRALLRYSDWRGDEADGAVYYDNVADITAVELNSVTIPVENGMAGEGNQTHTK